MRNKIIVYHGSDKIIKEPRYGLGNRYNDYGQGFYCTDDEELSKEWACPEVKNGFSNKYELDLTGLNILNLNEDGFSVLNWISILINNRSFSIKSQVARRASEYLTEHFLINTQGTDVIIGYRADDSYFRFAKDFINNTITLEQLEYSLKLGGLGEQIVLVSPKAFERIRFVSYEVAKGSVYNPKRLVREKTAKKIYAEGKGPFEYEAGGLFIMDIIRMGITKNEMLQ